MLKHFICIDIGKNHHFANVTTSFGEVLIKPFKFSNDSKGFKILYERILPYLKKPHLVGMEDTGHYANNLRDFLFSQGATIAMINPLSTDALRKASLKSVKSDKEDTYIIARALLDPAYYRIITKDNFSYSEIRELTRYHHSMQETNTINKERLQKALDVVFPEYNSLFSASYGSTYMRILKEFPSANAIAHADIRTLRKLIKPSGRGRTLSFTAEDLKLLAKESIAQKNTILELEIKHLILLIETINSSLDEVDKKIEEYSRNLNSPILSIPGIGHFSCTSIISEIGPIERFDNAGQIISYAGINPIVYQSGQYSATLTRISKKGSKYLRKTLYQIITSVIQNNIEFKLYYDKKISEGKSHRCAQGHCIRKLIRVIFKLLTTGESFDSTKLR